VADQVFLGAVFTNTDDDPIVAGDILIRDLTTDNGVSRTTDIASNLIVGVALGGADPGHQVSVATIMGQRVTMRILNGAIVARGDRLVSDNTEGHVRVDNAAPVGQVMAVATQAKGAGAGTEVEGILVAGGTGTGSSGGTLAQAYALGTVAGDQTLTLLDSKGGGVVLDATSGSFTGGNAFTVQSPAGDFVVERATGFVGINQTNPARELHAKGNNPGLRLEHDDGSTTTIVDAEYDGARFEFLDVSGANVLGYFFVANQAFYAKGGLVPSETFVASVPNTLTFPSDPAAAVGPADTARLRYNDSTGDLEVSLDGAAYVALATGAGSITGTLATDQIAFGSGANAIEGSANFTFDDNTIALTHGAATTGGLTVTGGDTAARSRVRLVDSAVSFPVDLKVHGSTYAGTNFGYPLAGQAALEATPDVSSALVIGTLSIAPVVLGVNSSPYLFLEDNGLLRLTDGRFQLENGSAIGVSAASTGAFRYDEITNKIQVSENGGGWVDLGSFVAGSGTLREGYQAGSGTLDQTLPLEDLDGGAFVIDATSGTFTGANAFVVTSSGGDFAVARATGFVGINETTPLAELHAAGVDPAIRLEHDDGSQNHVIEWQAGNFSSSFVDVTGAETLLTFNYAGPYVVLNDQVFIDGLGNAGSPALAHTVENQTGLFWEASDILGFSTAAIERLRITATGVFDFSNADSAPGGNPTSGYFVWAEGGALKGRGTSGTVVTIGPAEPHCPACGKDYMSEFDNAKYGHFAVCLSCLADEYGDKEWIVRGPSKLKAA
jgi:hypothetical protein